MATVSLFWDTNMAGVTSCENTLYRNQQWLPSKRFLFKRCDISFHFQPFTEIVLVLRNMWPSKIRNLCKVWDTRISVMGPIKLQGHRSQIKHIQPEVRVRNCKIKENRRSRICFQWGSKVVAQVLQTAWDMENSQVTAALWLSRSGMRAWWSWVVGNVC